MDIHNAVMIRQIFMYIYLQKYMKTYICTWMDIYINPNMDMAY